MDSQTDSRLAQFEMGLVQNWTSESDLKPAWSGLVQNGLNHPENFQTACYKAPRPPATSPASLKLWMCLCSHSAKSESALACILNQKRDIVDTFFHAYRAAWHNTYKQTSIPLSWSATELQSWSTLLVWNTAGCIKYIWSCLCFQVVSTTCWLSLLFWSLPAL